MKWKTTDQGMFVEQKNSLLRDKYFFAYYETAKRLLDLNKGDVVLDYGSGDGFFGGPNVDYDVEYIRYDKYIPSTYEYAKVHPLKQKYNKVVCNHVLEHLDDSELNEFCDFVKKKKPECLVISLPLENGISDVLGIFDGIHFSNRIEHSTRWNKVLNKFSKFMANTKIETVWGMTIVTKWEWRK